MTAPRADLLADQIQAACLSLLRLVRDPRYGPDPDFLRLLQGFLGHSRQLLHLIRDRAGPRITP